MGRAARTSSTYESRKLFGSVPSDTTVFRTVHEFDAGQRARLAEALAEVRARVWTKLDTTPENPVILDFDASLVDVHSELKEQAAPTRGRSRSDPSPWIVGHTPVTSDRHVILAE